MRALPARQLDTIFQLNRMSQHGETFCTSVEATNILGLVSERVSSDCILVDTTPPLMRFVGAGLEDGVHVESLLMMSSFLGNAAAADNESDVEAFEWCLRGPPSGGDGCDLSITSLRTVLPKAGNVSVNADRTTDLSPLQDAAGKVIASYHCP